MPVLACRNRTFYAQIPGLYPERRNALPILAGYPILLALDPAWVIERVFSIQATWATLYINPFVALCAQGKYMPGRKDCRRLVRVGMGSLPSGAPQAKAPSISYAASVPAKLKTLPRGARAKARQRPPAKKAMPAHPRPLAARAERRRPAELERKLPAKRPPSIYKKAGQTGRSQSADDGPAKSSGARHPSSKREVLSTGAEKRPMRKEGGGARQGKPDKPRRLRPTQRGGLAFGCLSRVAGLADGADFRGRRWSP